MSIQYFNAVVNALRDLLELARSFALPVAIVVGLIFVSKAIALQRGESATKGTAKAMPLILAGLGLTIVFYSCWSVLQSAERVANIRFARMDRARATSTPVSEAPSVHQAGPAAALLVPKTYTRTLTLPPKMVERLGADGLGVIAPYLTDPTATKVQSLVDSFTRSGSDVVFTRELTRVEEKPLPFTKAEIVVDFERLEGTAYDTTFVGIYSFRNPTSEPANARFDFPLPKAGTIREISATIDGQPIDEPETQGRYMWEGELAAGETKTATVKYRVVGSRNWSYDFGSRRRRADELSLVVHPGGPARFLRGSLEPTSQDSETVEWKLSNVISNQEIALIFPRDTLVREGFLQALFALRYCLAALVIGLVLLSAANRRAFDPVRVGLAILILTFGFGAATVAAQYVAPLIALTVLPALSSLIAARVLETDRWLFAVSVGLMPATFLSQGNTGAWMFVLVLSALMASGLLRRFFVRTPADAVSS